MAIEQPRGCGYRRVGATYLVGGILNAPCDRLPIQLSACRVCGQGVRVGRAFTEINPAKLWGDHEGCIDKIRPCFVCDLKDRSLGFLMLCGEKFYSVQSFLREAQELGVSKRIPFVPRNLKLEETPVYLVHNKAIYAGKDEEGKDQYKTGIFAAFIPSKIEKLLWQSEADEKTLKDLEKRNITPVIVPESERGKEHDPKFKDKIQSKGRRKEEEDLELFRGKLL